MTKNDEFDNTASFNYSDISMLLHPAVRDVFTEAKRIRIPAGTQLFRETECCKDFMWLLNGTVRVYKHSPEGREITLYRVNPGEVCVLSVQSLLCDEGFPAEAVAESAIFGLSLNRFEFEQALDNSKEFHRYLLKTLAKRTSDIMQLVSQVTFQHLDLRVACHLGKMFEQNGGKALKTTHAKIAQELGTTREMVSRILKELEKMHCIELSRGEINLLSSEGLQWARRVFD